MQKLINYLQTTADAIRQKTGRTLSIPCGKFGHEILSIPTHETGKTIVTVLDSLIDLNIDSNQNIDNAYQCVKNAISFWNAKFSGTRTFDYKDGNNPFKGNVNNSNGDGIIDCSGYIGMVLRGYDYLTSIYATNKTANATIDGSTIPCLNKTWTEDYLDFQSYDGELTYGNTYSINGKYRCITASDIALFYQKLGRTWLASDTSKTPQIGDICFFYKTEDDGSIKYENRFLGISHIGIMITPSLYLNATEINQDNQGIIATKVSARPPFMYARPFYGSLRDGIKTKLSSNNDVNLLSSIWSGLKQGTTTKNGNQLVLSGNTLTVNTTGTRSGTTIDVNDELSPIYLPAGTYKLSGFTNNTGKNTASATHSTHGLRVWGCTDMEGGTYSGVSGTTTSSNGSATATRSPAWDVGGGCEFTLTQPTLIKVDLYLGNDSTSWTYENTVVEPKLVKIA